MLVQSAFSSHGLVSLEHSSISGVITKETIIPLFDHSLAYNENKKTEESTSIDTIPGAVYDYKGITVEGLVATTLINSRDGC